MCVDEGGLTAALIVELCVASGILTLKSIVEGTLAANGFQFV